LAGGREKRVQGSSGRLRGEGRGLPWVAAPFFQTRVGSLLA